MTNMGLRNVEFQFQLQEKELWHDMFKYHWDYACQNNAQLSLDDINSVIYYQNNDSDNSFVEHTSKTLIVEIRNPYSNDSTNHYQFEVTSDLDAQFAECMKQPLDTDELHRIQYNLMNSQIIACEAYQKELLKKLSKSSRDITFYQLHNAFHNQKIKELEEFSNKLDSKMTTSAEFNNDNLNYITTLEREVDELKLQLEKSENTNSTEMKVANEKYSDLLIQSRDLKRKLLQYQSINAKNELDPSILAKSVVENRLKEQIEDLINKTKDQELTIKILQENPIYNNISSSEIRELRQQRAKQSSIIHDLQQEIKKYKNELHEFHNLQNLLNLMGYSSIASASAQSPRYFKVSSQPSHLSTPSPLIKSSATLIQSNNLAKEIMNRIRKYEVKNRVINEQLQEVNEMNITLKQRVLMLEKELRVFSGNPSSVFGKLSKSQFDLEFDTMKLQGENNILKDQISHLRNLAIQSKSRVHDMLVALHDVSFQMKNSIINQNGDESMLMPLQELIDYFEATMHMKVDSKSSSSPSSLTQLNHHGSPSTGSSFRMSPKLSVSSVEKTSPSKQMNDSYASKSISEIQEYCKPIVEERLYQNIFSRYLSKSLVSPIHRNGLSNSPVSEAQDEEGFMNRSRFHRFCNEFQLCVNGLTRGNTALKGLIKGEIDIVFDVNARSNVNGNKPHASPARDTFGYGHSTFKSPSSEFNKTPDRLNAGSKAIPSLHLVFQQFIKAIEDIALKTYRKEVDDYMTSLTHSRGLAEEYDALAVKYAVKLLMYHKIIPVAKNLGKLRTNDFKSIYHYKTFIIDLIPWELIYFDRIVTNLSLKEKLYLDLRTNMKVIEAWFTYYENMIQYNLLSSTTTVDKLLRFARDFGVFPFLVTEKEIFQ